uniref:SET domain-containing protein n=1 Tax=viral metagenome TaxID=1070528 RepID=A0A6C0C321_9ZZZZ
MKYKQINRDTTMSNFLSWLNKKGAVFPDIYFQKYKNGERGVHAKISIPEQDEVIKIPRKLLIYSSMGENSPWGKKVANNSANISGINLVYICLYILQDMIHENKFGPYYKILPTQFDNFPIFWNASDIKCLENSYLLREIDIRKKILMDDYNALCQILIDFNFSQVCSLQLFLQLRTIVGSRNFGLWIDGKNQATLTPLGDLLNHSTNPDVKWTFEDKSDAFVMNAIRTIKSHSAISDSYGTKCNRSYLLFYGFALPDNKQCRNTVYLQLTQSVCTVKIQNMRDQLISKEFSRNICSDFNNLNFRQMLTFLRIANANETELYGFLNNKLLSQNPYSKRNEAAALSDLSLTVSRLANSYSIPLKKNKQCFKKLPPYSNKSFATMIVMNEKKIMQEILAFTKQALGVILCNNRVSARKLENNIKGYMITLQNISS